MIEAPHLREEGAHPAAPASNGIEQRVQRLEDAVAALQDTRQLEERLVDRVADRLGRTAPLAMPAAAGVIIEAGRQLLPAAAPRAGGTPPRLPWLLLDLYAELRAIFWMFLDRGYRLTWTCRLVLPVLLLLMVSSWFIIGAIPLVGALLDKAVDVVLVVVAYKVLSREAHRYRGLFPHFPSSARP
jgi:hypothetical protein